jgi:hypothetical protein
MSVGVDRVIAECTPEDKVRVVREARERGTVLMAGDGVSDAPALASADVGVALAGERVSAASETADVVLVANRLDRLALVVSLAQYARRIARQSVALGMGLSVIGMAAAAAGFIIPAVGALLQEAIDVLAVANALRLLLYRQERPSPRVRALSLRFEAEHEALHRGVDEIVRLAGTPVSRDRPQATPGGGTLPHRGTVAARVGGGDPALPCDQRRGRIRSRLGNHGHCASRHRLAGDSR